MKILTKKLHLTLLIGIVLMSFFSSVNAIAPVISDAGATTVSFTEGSLPVTLTSSIAVLDLDGLSLSSYALIKITDNFKSSEDLLSASTGTYDSDAGELTITGYTTAAQYQAALKTVKYDNINEFDPNTNTRIITITIYDGAEVSGTLKYEMTITGVNDRPVVTNPGSPSVDFTEGSTGVYLLPSVEIVDDNTNLSQATLTLADATTDDLLSVTGSGLSSSYSSVTGILTLSGSASVATYQAALRLVKYQNTNTNNPKVGARGITYKVKDASLESTDNTVTINVIGVDDAPTLGGANGTITYNEGDAATIVASGITVADVDNTTLSSATISISNNVAGEDELSVSVSSPLSSTPFNSTTGILTISGAGTVAQYQAALKNVKYRNLNDTTPNSTTRDIDFLVNDGELNSNIVSQYFLVYPTNDAPVAYADAYTGISEGGTLIISAANGVLKNDRDPDGPIALTAQLISNPSYGTLTLNSNGSFTYVHNGSEKHVDQFTYRAFDSQAQSSVTAVQITIGAVNNAPVLSGIEATTLAYNEDDASKTITSTIAVSDSDDANLASAIIQITGNYLSSEDSLYYTNIGGSVSYNKTTGTITLTGALSLVNYQTFLKSIKYVNYNHANPSTLTRTISFTVSDGNAYSNTVSRYISVTRVNDPPIATNAAIIGSSTYYIGEHLNATFTFTDPDGDLEGLHTYKWYNATSTSGASMTAISGAVKDTFTIRMADGGKYIGVVPTPVDDKGLSGIGDTSVFHYVNAAPVFSDTTVQNLVHPNSFAVGETVTANFIYYDKEGNTAGTNQYQWYRSSSSSWTGATAISGATSTTYKIVEADKDKFIAMKARPVANAGSTPGRYFTSPWYSVSLLPSITLTGVDSICNDGTTFGNLPIVISSSNPPVSFTYKRNNGTPVTISGIQSANFNYTLTVANADTGTYKILSVSDTKYSYGIRIDSIGKVKHYPKPSATFSTSDTLKICDGDLTVQSIPVNLQGKAPWSITYKRENQTIIPSPSGILTSPYNIPVNYTQTGKYTITTVTDGNSCTAAGTGQRVVTLKTSPIARITNNSDTSTCPSTVSSIDVKLASGTTPWRFTYKIDETNFDSTITGIAGNNFVLKVQRPGTYRISKIYDNTNKEGCSIGSKKIINYTVPSATISGSGNTCEGTTALMNVTLTGTQPWKVIYSLEGVVQDSVKGITSSPGKIEIKKAGNYLIQSVADAHCPGTTSGNYSLSITNAPPVSIGIGSEVFALDDNAKEIKFTPPKGIYSAVPNPICLQSVGDSIVYFIPFLAGKGTTTVNYQYTDPVTSCVGKTSKVLTVVGEDGFIQSVDTKYDTIERICSNFDSILIKGYPPLGVTTQGSFSISGSNPPEKLVLKDNGNNTAYLYPKNINSPLSRTVTFTCQVGGTTKRVTKVYNFEKVIASIKWDNDCFNGSANVLFTNNSTSEDTIKAHYWQIDFPTTVKNDSGPEIRVNFDQIGTYPVTYIAVSSYGCTDTIKGKDKKLIFSPTVTPLYSPYFEDFQDGTSDWTSGIISDTANTWTLGQPSGKTFIKPPTGTQCWYTNVTTKYKKAAEYSYVVSPCFSFKDASRPMIKMKIWRGFTYSENSDGAVLEYWTPENDWKALGKVDDKINWYNSDEIEGTPGLGKIGWTSKDAIGQDNNWVDVRHSLDVLINEPSVKFRIAYGTKLYNNLERDGIAFDDIWIGERTKKVLFEHFTNNESADCFLNNSIFNQFINKNALDAIDLQYHMDFPGTDTFYIQNPYPSYSRKYYYDLNDVPYSILNGGGIGKIFDYSSSTAIPDQDNITEAVLQDNKFYLKTIGKINGDVLDITTDIKALETISSRPITLQIVIIENEVKGFEGKNGETVFESVVRDMVPGTAGTQFEQSWDIGTTQHIENNWDIPTYVDRDELRVVAFLQDETTGEVYQAVSDNPNLDETDVKSHPDGTHHSFILYPNPTTEKSTLYWTKPLDKITRVDILDNIGRVLRSYKMMKGEQATTISLKGLEAGTYIIRTTTLGSSVESQKIILLSNN